MFIKKISSLSLRFVLMTVASLVLSVGAIWAQNVKVTGTVTDKNGEPLVGVYVLVQGTKTGTSTDVDGKYALSTPPTGTLVFSSMGYQNLNEVVNNRSVINVTLQDDAVLLEDVVVTALGIKKERKALGYSVTDMNAKELLKNKNTNVVNSLAGKVAGVNITQSGGGAGSGSTIVIRGGNSASESRDNQPLFVVDGIIYDNSTPNGGNSLTDGMTKTNTTFSNRVMDINPEDIENMSVLKGAAAAALYGSRAADGVVIITTKKGAEGVVRVNVSSKYTYSWVNSLPEQQSIYGRGQYNVSGILEKEDGTTSSWGEKIDGTIYNNVEDFFQGGSVWDNSVSISGGGKNNSFYLSASRFDQTGIVPTTGYDKTTFRFNGEQKIGIFKVGANVAYSLANTDKTLTSSGLYGGGGNGAMTAIYGWSRDEDMSHYLNEDGTKYFMFPTSNVDQEKQVENPYWMINKNKLDDKNERITGGINISADLTKWFNIVYRAGLDSYTTDANTYIAPNGNVLKKYQNGRLNKSSVDYNYVTSNLMLNFHKKFGDWDLNLLLGHTAEATKRVNKTQWGYDFIIDGKPGGTINFNDILNVNKYFTDNMTKKRMVGAYGEFRAAYKNIAYLTVTGRNDWSSTLSKESRSYFYPSVSGSFVFTELLPKSNWLTFGKVRASWAEVGKDADPYSTGIYLWPPQTVSKGFIGTGNNWTGGQPNLLPERQRSWEVGLEVKFFNGRLGFDYTYYDSETRDQLVNPRLAQSTGYIFLTLNSGSVRNRGMELSITGTPIAKKNFTWDMTLNLSGNRGTLGDFVDGVDLFYVTDVQTGGAKAASVPNGGYFLGLTGNKWKTHENGQYLINTSTGLYDDTTVETNIVGNREPTMIGGFNNSLQYKNWNLSFLFDIRIGGDIYNGTEYYMLTNGLSTKTINRESVTVSGVTKDGKDFTQTYNANDTYVIAGAKKSGQYMIQEYWKSYAKNSYNFITDTNWLRLRSLSLSYDFSNLIKGQNILKNLTATFTGTNLWVWTNYKGMDPEVSVSGSGTGGSGSMGIDYCGVPSTAGVSFGLNLTF
ncbi:MAG: SusC/RagA family TonB-linked outer membrane protein [Bacteroidales bacterium]